MKDINGIPFTLTGQGYTDIFFPFILYPKEYIA